MGKVILGELGKNKGGVIKKRTGARKTSMNKGGLLLSSVDNRKKKVMAKRKKVPVIAISVGMAEMKKDPSKKPR